MGNRVKKIISLGKIGLEGNPPGKTGGGGGGFPLLAKLNKTLLQPLTSSNIYDIYRRNSDADIIDIYIYIFIYREREREWPEKRRHNDRTAEKISESYISKNIPMLNIPTFCRWNRLLIS